MRQSTVFAFIAGCVLTSGVPLLGQDPTDCASIERQKISDIEGSFEGELSDDDWMGLSVASLGDLDGDGVPDLAVGAMGDDSSDASNGAVWILFLNGDGTVRSHHKISDAEGELEGEIDSSGFGSGVASLGDLDGDGVTDLAVGAIFDSDGGVNSGAVWILFLGEDGTVQSFEKIGGDQLELEDQDFFGSSIAPLEDIDGDGIVDLAVGGVVGGAPWAGSIWILFLNDDGTVRSYERIREGEGGFTGELEALACFGSAIAPLGDVDDDGIPDLAVGSRGDSDDGDRRGALWILFLDEDGTVASHQKISDTEGGFRGGLNDRDLFGTSLAHLGDVDDDGSIELAVGAPGDDDGGAGRGSVWVLSLDSDGTVECHHKISDTEGGLPDVLEDGDGFGRSLAASGDIDGDDGIDLVVGAAGDDDGGDDRGAVWVLMGCAPRFKRGDCDGDGEVSPIEDSARLLNYAFQSEAEPPCLEACNSDGSGSLDPLLDALYLLSFEFLDTPPPPEPGPDDCGFDPDLGATRCVLPPDCD